jgi:ABC-2 type transport system permease protein
MLRGPIVYVIGGLFLVVQGIAFAGLVAAMSDPRKPAPLGALLEGQLAGTLLTWVLQLVVLTLLGMRAIADDHKSGGWELLLTTRVSERAAVVGKWLAATIVYAILWLPTLAYLVVVAMFRSDAGGWDIPTIVVGYAGAIAVGSALLAWAIAASAATSSTLAAGGLGFALLIGLFLTGEIGELWPAADVHAISLRDLLSSLARGEVTVATIAAIAGLAVVGLSLATTLACAGRRTRREVAIRAASTLAVAVLGASVVVFAVRHPMRWDVAGTNELDPQTAEAIGALDGPAKLTIVEPTAAALEPVYAEIGRVADRMADAGSITVAHVDPATVPGGLPAAARLAGIAQKDLASGGAVIVELGARRRVIDLFALASIEQVRDGVAVRALAIEQAITGALAELSTDAHATICASTGHGELPLVTHANSGLDWTAVHDRLRADGFDIDEIAIGDAVPARCAALVIAGPATPLSPPEALAVQAYEKRGGGVVVAAAARPVPGAELVATGLEGMLADDGLGLPLAIAVDPTLAVPNVRGGLLVTDGYSDHPIDAGFASTRATIWFQPRVVIASAGAKPLVSATAASWGERDLQRDPPVQDPDDIAGPVAIAAIGSKHRVVAIGSAESMSQAVLAGGASAGDLWTERAIRFVAGKTPPPVAIAPRAPTEIRLVMTSDQRRIVMALSIAGIPLAWGVVGAAVLLLRRRRRRA